MRDHFDGTQGTFPQPVIMATEMKPKHVGFNVKAIMAAWETADDLPPCVAAAVTNEFTAERVNAADGEMIDRDVEFADAGVMVEEKAVGVCDRETADKYAPYMIDPDRDDGKVMAVNPHQIYTGWKPL